jgi:hypothetical protein
MSFLLKQKITFIVVLLFCILAYNNIIFFNEEAIVALCFILFVGFSYETISEAIISELNDKFIKMQKEFNFKIREERLKLLIDYYPKMVSSFEEILNIYKLSVLKKKSIITRIHLIMINNILLDLKKKLQTIQLQQLNLIKKIKDILLDFDDKIMLSLKGKIEDEKVMIRKYLNTALETEIKKETIKN